MSNAKLADAHAEEQAVLVSDTLLSAQACAEGTQHACVLGSSYRLGFYAGMPLCLLCRPLRTAAASMRPLESSWPACPQLPQETAPQCCPCSQHSSQLQQQPLQLPRSSGSCMCRVGAATGSHAGSSSSPGSSNKVLRMHRMALQQAAATSTSSGSTTGFQRQRLNHRTTCLRL